jgi:hypothetical protein
MVDQQGWLDLTAPSHWNGGIGVPFPARAWVFQDGVLSTSTRTWQSLYSKQQYRDFELTFEWKLAPGSNSGVKYLCAEGMIDPDWQASVASAPYALGGLFLAAAILPVLAWRILKQTWLRWTLTVFSFVLLVAALSGSYLYVQAKSRIARVPPGFEYQVIDNVNYRIPLQPAQLTGSLYDLIAAPPAAAPPAMGEWHQARVLVKDGKVEHWLDGKKLIEFELGSEALRKAVSGSKFRRVPGFAERRSGYLQLQAHDGEAAFRHIRIRPF